MIFIAVVDNYYLLHLLKSAGFLYLAEVLKQWLGKSFGDGTEATNRLQKSSSIFHVSWQFPNS